MILYKAEILGAVPNGLTANDVYASIISMMGEKMDVDSSSVRRSSRGMVSVIVKFWANDYNEAKETARYAVNGVTNFSADIVGPTAFFIPS